jgi:hypothetical protein
MSIIKKHCIISLQEIVDYEILLEGNPFDVSGVDLLDSEYRKNLEFLVDLAYKWYGEEVIENFKKDNKLTFQCLAKFIFKINLSKH